MLDDSIGKNIRFLVDRKDEDYCFRLHKDKVYYVRYVALLGSCSIVLSVVL